MYAKYGISNNLMHNYVSVTRFCNISSVRYIECILYLCNSCRNNYLYIYSIFLNVVLHKEYVNIFYTGVQLYEN